MILKKITTAGGINWTQSNQTNPNLIWDSLCATPTGRIIAGSAGDGIWYSDDNGINWTQSNKTNLTWLSLCATPTGRIIAGSQGEGIWYSDDNGINWTQSNDTQSNKTTLYWYSLCVTPTGRIIAGGRGIIADSQEGGIWYFDPECTVVCTKYLDQNGAQEIVTQFKAYCDNLVGGA